VNIRVIVLKKKRFAAVVACDPEVSDHATLPEGALAP